MVPVTLPGGKPVKDAAGKMPMSPVSNVPTLGTLVTEVAAKAAKVTKAPRAMAAAMNMSEKRKRGEE